MIKYLYVLVSDDSDYYLEQALMSITSLKMYTPDAFVSLLIDDITEKTMVNKRRNMLELVDELKVVEIESQFNKKARSRWLKTSMRQLIEGDFLYIDCDTVICEDLSDIENINIDLGAVLDSHILLNDHCLKKSIQENDKMLGFSSSSKMNKHFNSGIIYCKDSPICHSFFYEWHSLWLKGYAKLDIDQPSFNQAIFNFGDLMREINGIWNCQVCSGGIAFLVDAKIIHYFATRKNNTPYILSNTTVLEKIKNTGIIDSETRRLLTRPKTNFYSSSHVLANKKDIEIMYSSLFSFLRYIYDWKFVQVINKLLMKVTKSK